jgi:hypothetical protein
VRFIIFSLLRKNLIQRTVDDLGNYRFRMLETIHDFAYNILISESQIFLPLRIAFVDYYTNWCSKAHQLSYLNWSSWSEFTIWHGNIRQALDWSLDFDLPDQALKLAYALSWYWAATCQYHEASHYLNAVIQKSSSVIGNDTSLLVRGVIDRLEIINNRVNEQGSVIMNMENLAKRSANKGNFKLATILYNASKSIRQQYHLEAILDTDIMLREIESKCATDDFQAWKTLGSSMSLSEAVGYGISNLYDTNY